MQFIKQLQLEKDITNQIAKHSTIKTYSNGEQIIFQNIHKDQISFIDSGLIKVYIEEENSSLFLYHLESKRNNILSLMNIFSNAPSQVSMMALQETTLYWVPNSIIRELLRKSPKLKSAIFKSDCYLHQNLINTIKKMTLHSKEDRIYDYLKIKLEHHKVKKIKVTHMQLAKDLNFSRETISRGLRNLEKNDRIKRASGWISISL
ncbi:CRP-like cAMP-binding protein [Aquimarina sp. EL_43]|uniref:Crp/Fnr family transcriptional regulator n=1 Tax=Aquimarina TaxID=290174 RepID=UPI00047203E6|nr:MULTISPECIES: Crp/Fnr family transcriptional regulator [Aquimarina]MBG6132166.1 CRP-like cAMP-binding protein [Aquimarina sp. EL_35]MBG6152963.1 CRP-like cAMP-binding protein [Aquimarina sp. EL_32]MBG6170970.1 CRP-like cAMP-binding protein [Aquimarina sp. EL_43]